MLFLLSPKGRGIAPLIELSVVNRIFVLLLLLLRFHGLGANESQLCSVNACLHALEKNRTCHGATDLCIES